MSVKSHSASSVCMEQRSKKNASNRAQEDSHEEEMDDKGIIKRKSRNLSEKKRRDQFNVLINELCSMVCTGKRKIDKSTVLKSAISFIRNHNQVAMQSQSQEVQEDWKPSFLSNEEFTHLMLEALDGFIMVLTAAGKILYISENITSLLGHIPNDLVGTVIYDLIWEDEREQVQTLLRNWATVDQLSTGKENHVNLSCHLRRGNSRDNSLENNYELVLFSGYYRIQSSLDVPTISNVSVSSCGDDSKGSSCGDSVSQHDGLVFVATARLQTPQLIVEMSLVDVSKSEFTSRHSLEWKFLFLDHRAPPIIGYLPFEVLGTSGYDYYHVDDLDKVSACHEALMQKGEGTSCCYRFLTKGQQWIWLQTRYYITYHQWNSKPEFIVCTHKVVSYNEVIGHPIKETSTAKNERHCSNSMEEQMISTVTTMPNSKTKSFVKSSSSSNQNMSKRSSVSEHSHSSSYSSTLMGSSNSCKRDGRSASGERTRSSPKFSGHQRHQQQSHASNRESPVSDPVLLPPPAVPMSESITQHNRHPSGSSRGVGAAMSDAGSISSSGSFHSAASQHSRQSDQSMQSLHSQQSHHSMQSAHSQMSQQSQSLRSSSQASTVHPSNCSNQQQNKHLSNSQQQQHYGVLNNCQSRLSSTQTNARSNNVETYFSSPVTITTTTLNAGHRFLQPQSKNVNSSRRNSSGNGQAAGSTVTALPVSAAAGAMYQPVLPLGIEENSNQGVTLPLQHVIEGLPVVTLPGLVAHEPIRMTVAQRQLHEQLKLKHAQLQRQIAAQQEELRRVSEQLLLAQYGAWGSTVLKMTVPYTEAQGTPSTSNQPTHAILSAGGLVTCLTGTPVGIGQNTSSQLGTGATTPVTFSPGTPILVQSPSILAHSPPAESICMTADPPQVVLRAASQQDTLVQLTQQDVQMLLAQSLLQDSLPPSTEFL